MQNLGKTNFKKLTAYIFIFFSLFTVLNAASVKAEVSNTDVVQGNMVQLKITAIGNRAAFPNIKAIGDAPVLGKHQGQNNSITYINGKMNNTRSTTVVLTFSPKHDMTIPSYSVNIDGDVYKTDPIELKVSKSTAPKVASGDRFALQMSANKKSVMVGEPVLVTVYFSMESGTRLSENPQYTPPSFKNFFVKEVGKEKIYTQGSRSITELRYMLTPKKEGNFTIEPARAKIGVADTSRRDMFGRFFGTLWVPIQSNSIHIEVKPVHTDADLVGNFYIDSTLDKTQTKVNKPVNLTLKIEGEGNLEDFEFPSYNIDGVTIYSDDAKVNSEVVGKKLKSTYVKSFAFISDTDFTIPSKTITVYNPKTKKVKKLEIPSYEVHVDTKKAAGTVNQKTTKEKPSVVQTNIKQSEVLKEDMPKKKEILPVMQWWMLAIAFILGIGFMYIVQFLPKINRKQSSYNESEALKILYAHINESEEVEEMVRKLYARKNGNKSISIDKKELKALVEKYK